jgi:hypothetical protein
MLVVFILNQRKTFFISFSLMFVFILLFQLSYAQVRTAGVSEGDWFKYNLSLDFDSLLNMTSEDFPFADFLIGETVTLTIQNVSGTNVTGMFTIEYENGTEYSQVGSVDLTTGEGDLRSWLIAANLNAGDPLYTSEPNEMINETSVQTYFWGARETNHLIYSYNFTSEEDYSYLNVDMFWDMETGVVTNLSFEADAFVNGTAIDASAEWLIADSSIVEDVPEFTGFTLFLTIVVVTVLISILKYQKQKRKPSTLN